MRKRLLPALVRERFRAARSELDQKHFDAAEAPLTEARLMIVEAETLGVKDDGLGDLSVLVDGFLQLIRFESEKRASAPPAAAASRTGRIRWTTSRSAICLVPKGTSSSACSS